MDGAARKVCDESNRTPEKDEELSNPRQGYDEGKVCGKLIGEDKTNLCNDTRNLEAA